VILVVSGVYKRFRKSKLFRNGGIRRVQELGRRKLLLRLLLRKVDARAVVVVGRRKDEEVVMLGLGRRARILERRRR
jgi:hypothetical protein